RPRDAAMETALECLRQSASAEVPGHELQWAENVGVAVTVVEKALRQHMALAETPEGFLAQVDGTRPTLARQAGELCREHGDLLRQVLALKEEVDHAAEAFRPATEVANKIEAASVPDFGALRQQAEELLAALLEHKYEEMKLV